MTDSKFFYIAYPVHGYCHYLLGVVILKLNIQCTYRSKCFVRLCFHSERFIKKHFIGYILFVQNTQKTKMVKKKINFKMHFNKVQFILDIVTYQSR